LPQLIYSADSGSKLECKPESNNGEYQGDIIDGLLAFEGVLPHHLFAENAGRYSDRILVAVKIDSLAGFNDFLQLFFI